MTAPRPVGSGAAREAASTPVGPVGSGGEGVLLPSRSDEAGLGGGSGGDRVGEGATNRVGPVRIQLRRTKGWRKPDGAVVVARPSKWGNPFTVARIRKVERELGFDPSPEDELRGDVVLQFENVVTYGPDSPFWQPDNFQAFLVIIDSLNAGELTGRNLACWCRLDQPCHADVLLELANAAVPS